MEPLPITEVDNVVTVTVTTPDGNYVKLEEAGDTTLMELKKRIAKLLCCYPEKFAMLSGGRLDGLDLNKRVGFYAESDNTCDIRITHSRGVRNDIWIKITASMEHTILVEKTMTMENLLITAYKRILGIEKKADEYFSNRLFRNGNLLPITGLVQDFLDEWDVLRFGQLRVENRKLTVRTPWETLELPLGAVIKISELREKVGEIFKKKGKKLGELYLDGEELPKEGDRSLKETKGTVVVEAKAAKENKHVAAVHVSNSQVIKVSTKTLPTYLKAAGGVNLLLNCRIINCETHSRGGSILQLGYGYHELAELGELKCVYCEGDAFCRRVFVLNALYNCNGSKDCWEAEHEPDILEDTETIFAEVREVEINYEI